MTEMTTLSTALIAQPTTYLSDDAVLHLRSIQDPYRTCVLFDLEDTRDRLMVEALRVVYAQACQLEAKDRQIEQLLRQQRIDVNTTVALAEEYCTVCDERDGLRRRVATLITDRNRLATGYEFIVNQYDALVSYFGDVRRHFIRTVVVMAALILAVLFAWGLHATSQQNQIDAQNATIVRLQQEVKNWREFRTNTAPSVTPPTTLELLSRSRIRYNDPLRSMTFEDLPIQENIYLVNHQTLGWLNGVSTNNIPLRDQLTWNYAKSVQVVTHTNGCNFSSITSAPVAGVAYNIIRWTPGRALLLTDNMNCAPYNMSEIMGN
jgi:hypothetical protein